LEASVDEDEGCWDMMEERKGKEEEKESRGEGWEDLQR
jgi:hypothetical protein